MKKRIKKALALTLAAITLLSTCAVMLTASAQEVGAIPTVYVQGQGHHLKKVKGDPSSEPIYPLEYSMDYILGVIDELNPVFAKAYVTGDYSEYCDVICDAVEPIFEEIQLDKNAEASDGSGVPWSWPASRLRDEKQNGQYGLMDYNYVYDWRLDPCALADGLDDYISEVKAVTGASKVNLVSRCLGCNIVLAYLYEYGYEDIAKCIFYASTIDGTAACSKTFSGQIVVDPDGAERYAYDRLADDDLMEFLKASVALLNRTQGLNLAADFVDSVYRQVKPEIVPRLLKMTYGGFPTYWSMVGAEDYEAARELVFGDCEEEYAGTLEKIDHYHNDIQAKSRTILSDAKAAGVDIAVISKYGYQLTPIAPNSDDIADGIVELRLASLGATTSKVSDTLSRKYIKNAVEAGKGKYISPDKQVDASTCFFPDTTWIVKGIEHKAFPASMDELICAILSYDGQMTVDTNPLYPQYLSYDDETDTVSPLTAENVDEESNWNKNGIIGVVIEFFTKLLKVIKEYLIPLIKEKLPKTAN